MMARVRTLLLSSLVVLSLALPAAALACSEGSGRQFLFAAPAADIPAPLVAIEGAVVNVTEDEVTLRLAKAVKGVPAETEVTIRRTGSRCGHEWGAVEGNVAAIGGFRSFRLPKPVFEAVPLKPQRLPHSDIRKYIVDPDYVRQLEGAAAHD